MSGCLFCKIIRKEIPSEIVFEDDFIVIFKDIHPAAAVHLLVVPKAHIPSVRAVKAEDEKLLGKLLTGAKKAAEEAGIAESGYRLIINNGPDAGQEIPHLHLHVLGGGKMKHPMG